jgi:hypothetical protein
MAAGAGVTRGAAARSPGKKVGRESSPMARMKADDISRAEAKRAAGERAQAVANHSSMAGGSVGS